MGTDLFFKKVPEDLLDAMKHCKASDEFQIMCDENIWPITLDYFVLMQAEDSILYHKSYARRMFQEGEFTRQEANRYL